MGAFTALWWRDVLKLKREPGRWLGVVAQPVLFWVIIGSGFATTFRLPGATGLSYLEYFFPGTLVMCVLFTAIFGSISVIEDRQAGFLRSALASPAQPLSLILGKVAGVATIAMVQSALFLLLAPFAEVQFSHVAWPSLVASLAVGSCGLAALNLFMALKLNSPHSYHALMSVLLIPLWILSGALFPLGENWLATLASVNPMSYFVAAVRDALGGQALPGPPPDVSPLFVLAGFTLVFILLAARAMREAVSEF